MLIVIVSIKKGQDSVKISKECIEPPSGPRGPRVMPVPIFRAVAPEAYVLEVLGNYGVLPRREVDTTPFNADTSRKPDGHGERVASYVPSISERQIGQGVLPTL